jgi:DNA-directed RNA polymerase sigma subunit (sigma70/sigma32)
MTDPNEKKKYDMEMTAEDVAKVFGVSRQQIANIEKRALAKARKLIERKLNKQDIIPD